MPPVPLEVPAQLGVVVLFGFDQVVELSTDDPAVLEGHALDAQPLDGWNLLTVAVDPGGFDAETLEVALRRIRANGEETTEQISIPIGRSDLQLLTDAWRFDPSGVDESCIPPAGSTDNQLPDPAADVFGNPIGDAPRLPEPGASPENPAEAADEALASLRVVYDITDIYAEGKRDHLEDPEEFDEMRKQLLANDVVAPYMSNLDPEFRSSVFVSPTEVHILYRVGPTYQWEIGRVLLIDDKWRVARGTVCRDLSAAGYTCRGVVPDPPPGPLG